MKTQTSVQPRHIWVNTRLSTAIHEGSGTAMLLLESSRSDLHDWVVLTLVYDDYRVVDFGYRAIDEMAMS